MAEHDKSGHRQRLRDRFVTGEASSRTDEAILELLLTYAIPQRDVQPLAKQLVARFGSLKNVLAASLEDLCRVSGIKENTAVLIKLTNHIASSKDWKQGVMLPIKPIATPKHKAETVTSLFDRVSVTTIRPLVEKRPPAGSKKRVYRPISKKGTDLFSIPALEEAITLLPALPDTDDLETVKEFLRSNLHYSSQKTRQSYAAYIVKRMFPTGIIDGEMVRFARTYRGQQELRDACFYRFCKAEPLMQDIMLDVIIPAASMGKLRRERFRSFLEARFGRDNRNIKYCAKAAPQALAGARIWALVWFFFAMASPSAPKDGLRRSGW